MRSASTRRVAAFQRDRTVLQVPKSMAMVMAPLSASYRALLRPAMLCCVLFEMLSFVRGRPADHGLEKDVAPQAVADESDHHGIAIGHIGAAHALVQPRVEPTGVPYRADALQTGVTQSGFDFAKELEHVLRADGAARIGQRLPSRKLREERREAA